MLVNVQTEGIRVFGRLLVNSNRMSDGEKSSFDSFLVLSYCMECETKFYLYVHLRENFLVMSNYYSCEEIGQSSTTLSAHSIR